MPFVIKSSKIENQSQTKHIPKRWTFHASECSDCSLRDLKLCQTVLCSRLEANASRMAMITDANWFSYWVLQSDVQFWELGCLSNLLWKNTDRTQWKSDTLFSMQKLAQYFSTSLNYYLFKVLFQCKRLQPWLNQFLWTLMRSNVISNI